MGLETFSFDSMPESVADIQALLEKNRTSEFYLAALTVLALCKFETDAKTSIDMFNALRGSQPLSAYDVSFIKERLTGKGYKARSFVKLATPENGYRIISPITIEVSSNPYSYDQAGYATLYLKSGGADSERPIRLKKDDATGQWAVWEILFLSDIREPQGPMMMTDGPQMANDPNHHSPMEAMMNPSFDMSQAQNDMAGQTAGAPKFCRNCGAKLKENAKFCMECGEKI